MPDYYAQCEAATAKGTRCTREVSHVGASRCTQHTQAVPMRPRGLTLWVVYRHPADFPEDFVARRWNGATPTSQIFVGPTVEIVRAALRSHDPDLVRFTRSERDEPQIVEVWL